MRLRIKQPASLLLSTNFTALPGKVFGCLLSEVLEPDLYGEATITWARALSGGSSPSAPATMPPNAATC